MTIRKRTWLVLVALAVCMHAAPGHAQDVCDNPTFRVPGGPFKVSARRGDRTEPVALTAGTFVARSGVRPSCNCDLAVAFGMVNSASEGFIALLRGNESGTFSQLRETLITLSGRPRLMASGRFRKDIAVDFDGLVVVTTGPSGVEQAQVLVPDREGKYAPPQSGLATKLVGPDATAIATGHFNDDGILDVVIANKANRSLTILLGTEGGGFASESITVPDIIAQGGTIQSLATGQFSGAVGPDDIAVGVTELFEGKNRVGVVIVKNGGGRFAVQGVIPVGEKDSIEPHIAAANLSAQPEGPQRARRWRDLVVAYTDSTLVGRAKMLFGKDTGGFTQASAPLDLGRNTPRSIRVDDLDGDGVSDLIVSTFSNPASLNDGTIQLFKGQAAPMSNVGFVVNSNWTSIDKTAGIRPRSLVTGRFGANRPEGAPPGVGFAAISAPNHNRIVAFKNNGTGAFVQPDAITTSLEVDDRMFVAADFQSENGSNSVSDLAFVTQQNGQLVLSLRLSEGNGLFYLPEGSQQQFLPVGLSPSLIVAGQFVDGRATGIAIVDDTGGLGGEPLLRLFFGKGGGKFDMGTPDAPAVVSLAGIGRPRAIVTGRFRGESMPLDIAIASSTTPSGTVGQRSGKLTVLFNDGRGAFTVGTTHVLGFEPGSMATSSNLRSLRVADLVIRDAQAPRFLFLLNNGGSDGKFHPAANGNSGIFSGAGDVDALLVGNIGGASARDPAGPLDDVITFDQALRIKVFLNTGQETFKPPVETVLPNDPNFKGAVPPFVLADFGSGKLGLAAAVIRDGSFGMTLLKSNGLGGFVVATGEVPLQPIRGGKLGGSRETVFFQEGTGSFESSQFRVRQGMVAQLRSAQHGNAKPDLAFITIATERTADRGQCPGDALTVPDPRPILGTQCPILSNDRKECGLRIPCWVGECCICRRQHQSGQPPGGSCPTSCSNPGPAVPFHAFCKRMQAYKPALTVYGNTCGD